MTRPYDKRCGDAPLAEKKKACVEGSTHAFFF